MSILSDIDAAPLSDVLRTLRELGWTCVIAEDDTVRIYETPNRPAVIEPIEGDDFKSAVDRAARIALKMIAVVSS